MKLKNQLEEYLNQFENGFNDRHAIRYLCKRNPKLWKNILNKTGFLPVDAKPKQRCWHILNEMYEIPKCPVTNEIVKWYDNRYLTYSSKDAKTKDPKVYQKMVDTYQEKTGYTHWKNDPRVKKQSLKTYAENRLNGDHKIVDSPFSNPVIQEKIRNNCLEQYGVDNHSKRDEVRNKLKDPNKPARDAYRSEVDFHTRTSWNDHFDKINPERKVRGVEYHLDHIFSVYEGFEQNIPPEIIGHWTNLQMLEHEKNESKWKECWKTKEQLYEDYNKYKVKFCDRIINE